MARPIQPGLTENEFMVMKELWAHSPLTVAQILEKLDRQPKPAYTSLLTLVQAMEKKGYIGHHKEGKAYTYFPILKQSAFTSGEIQRMSERLFGGRSLSLLMNLIENEQLSREDVEQLKKMLEEL